MAKLELYIPAMGEGITEATITRWFKKEGDAINHDESIVEIATDKVDSEIPAPVSGFLEKILFPEGKTVNVGEVIAIISTADENISYQPEPGMHIEELKADHSLHKVSEEISAVHPAAVHPPSSQKEKFLSPLVRAIISKENLSSDDLDKISGTGDNGRITKDDILKFLETKSQPETPPPPLPVPAISEVKVIEMDRLRRLTAEHTLKSKQISPHVTSFLEADVTNIVIWRNKILEQFRQKFNEKITFTPIFIEATVMALKDFPMINISVEGNNILLKNYVNIGLATNLPSGNLIVPVIKNADNKNLIELTIAVNDLAKRARENKLMPDDIRGGTFTITNLGTFGVLAGTPIINQPEVAILGIGIIAKKPVVVETPEGDAIAIRQTVMLSLSFDHRVIDGYAAGVFMKKIAGYLEKFDVNRKI